MSTEMAQGRMGLIEIAITSLAGPLQILWPVSYFLMWTYSLVTAKHQIVGEPLGAHCQAFHKTYCPGNPSSNFSYHVLRHSSIQAHKLDGSIRWLVSVIVFKGNEF